MPTLGERLAEAKAKSAKLYQRRTEIQEQRQRLQLQAQQLEQQGRAVDLELYGNDSQVDLLELLVKEANG